MVVTLTDSAGAPVTDVVVRCRSVQAGVPEDARDEGGGVFACGGRGGTYSLFVWLHDLNGPLVVDQMVVVPGDYCDGPERSVPVSITVAIPTTSDAGSSDASTHPD